MNKKNNQCAPTYRQALEKAMKLFLMAPFFQRLQNEKNDGTAKQLSTRLS